MSPKIRRATFLPATQRFAARAFRPRSTTAPARVDLIVQLKRPCLNGDRARRGLRLRRLVNDSEAYAQARQPQGQDQAGRPCANDQDVNFAHRKRITPINKAKPETNIETCLTLLLLAACDWLTVHRDELPPGSDNLHHRIRSTHGRCSAGKKKNRSRSPTGA